MLTVIKLNPLGKEQTRYSAEVLLRLTNGLVLDAYWTRPSTNLGYTVFEPGDHFVEYYYTDQWFNIFAISTADGQPKGWYCNIAEPARINEEQVEQVDLLLDVWVNPDGQRLILDEDEFAADTTLTIAQRRAANQGLQTLLAMIDERRTPFFIQEIPAET